MYITQYASVLIKHPYIETKVPSIFVGLATGRHVIFGNKTNRDKFLVEQKVYSDSVIQKWKQSQQNLINLLQKEKQVGVIIERPMNEIDYHFNEYLKSTITKEQLMPNPNHELIIRFGLADILMTELDYGQVITNNKMFIYENKMVREIESYNHYQSLVKEAIPSVINVNICYHK